MSSIGRPFEGLRVEMLGQLELAEAKSDVGIEQWIRLVRCFRAHRQILLRDADPPGQLPEDLERGHAVAALDPADVHGRATRERKLALAHPCREPCVLQAPPDGDRVIDVWPTSFGHSQAPL